MSWSQVLPLAETHTPSWLAVWPPAVPPTLTGAVQSPKATMAPGRAATPLNSPEPTAPTSAAVHVRPSGECHAIGAALPIDPTTTRPPLPSSDIPAAANPDRDLSNANGSATRCHVPPSAEDQTSVA